MMGLRMKRVALVGALGVCLAGLPAVLPPSIGAAPPVSLRGIVQSGGTGSARSLGGVRVTLYEVTGPLGSVQFV
jgi:hypothetical protein